MAAKGYSARIRKHIAAKTSESFTGKDIAKHTKIRYTRIAASLQYLERTGKIRSIGEMNTGKRGRPRKVYINNMNKQLPVLIVG